MENAAATKEILEANEEGPVLDVQHNFSRLQDRKLTTRHAQCKSGNETFKPNLNTRRQHEADVSNQRYAKGAQQRNLEKTSQHM